MIEPTSVFFLFVIQVWDVINTRDVFDMGNVTDSGLTK